ncbi:hypothetical protein [Paenibacillus turpanensis]|uniref:hypothetical protein n=1 Tax=Paenibacillus turpanensis TaxID=2689078 RepID=UPI00140E2D0B|nr:hypothetical protein [Paenibacillus turpanensis]
MAGYWCIPIKTLHPVVFSAMRIFMAGEEAESFRMRLQQLHPRMLLSFKASLLLDYDDGACGGEDIDLDFEQTRDIVFDGNPLALSHCAEAFFDRLLAPAEAMLLLNQAMKEEWLPIQKQWLEQVLTWYESGYEVVLLKEGT